MIIIITSIIYICNSYGLWSYLVVFYFVLLFFWYCVIKTVSEQASHVMCILLQEATLPENRNKRPWIITMTHKPMYCSNNNPNDCTKTNSMVRLLIILKPVIFSFSCTLRDMGMGAGFFLFAIPSNTRLLTVCMFI